MNNFQYEWYNGTDSPLHGFECILYVWSMLLSFSYAFWQSRGVLSWPSFGREYRVQCRESDDRDLAWHTVGILEAGKIWKRLFCQVWTDWFSGNLWTYLQKYLTDLQEPMETMDTVGFTCKYLGFLRTGFVRSWNDFWRDDHGCSRERLRRVLRKKAAVVIHLQIYIFSPFTSADLHLLTFTSADLHLLTCTSADLHLLTCHICRSRSLTFTSADLDLSPSHLQI